MLRGSALRVTRPRVAVLSAVHDHPHADTISIIGAVREDLGEVSHQTVYDALHALTAVGLVRHIQPSGSVARYESRVGDNHHHIVCRSCGGASTVLSPEAREAARALGEGRTADVSDTHAESILAIVDRAMAAHAGFER